MVKARIIDVVRRMHARHTVIAAAAVVVLAACGQSDTTPTLPPTPLSTLHADPPPSPEPSPSMTFTATTRPTPTPTPTPVIASPPTATPKSTPTPVTVGGSVQTPVVTMTPSPTPGAVRSESSLSEAEAKGLTDPGIKAAMDDLGGRVEANGEPTVIVRAEHVTWRDASLGCPQPGVSYAQVLTPGIWLVLSHQSREFDYSIADTRAVLCQERRGAQPLDRMTLSGMWSRLAPVPTSRSEVAAADLNGKLYVLGGFGAGAKANEVYNPVTKGGRAGHRSRRV